MTSEGARLDLAEADDLPVVSQSLLRGCPRVSGPDEELPDVAEAAHAVVGEAMNAGVWVFGGGLYEQVSVVDTDGTVTDRPYPDSKAYVGGFSVVDVPSREEAL
jgi:hypothetical protein